MSALGAGTEDALAGVGPAGDDVVRGFERLSHADVEYAGGKGANLGELTAAGFPVPPGFVVGAQTYAAFCDATGLRGRIEERLVAVDVEDTEGLERAATDVRAMVEAETLPDDLATAIGDAYDRLAATAGDPEAPVAVRSSATAEDTESASFAGMNETLLNVRGARSRARGRARVLVLALRRPHDLLPRQARLRPGRHGHRRRRPAPGRVDPLRGDVHDRPGVGRHRPADHRGSLRVGRVGRLRFGLARPLRRRQGEADRPCGAKCGARS